ncbi:Vesicle transport protein SFT2B [Echinococcus granulosus]|uniref:Vesicle transport protein n=1 Tax=Echinococcus granulosus TaxID=6210 RepID=A0A068WMG1_ECHGR|nr:Vesicle transport protein SFT2B [Echinococcus granulosus]CDS21282.1 Vesicle transport protein SFT2B [Echinococcus granulosus]
MDGVVNIFSAEPRDDEEAIISDSGQLFPSLSYSTRIKGFAACFVLGVLMSLLSNLFFLLPGRGISLFALFYSIGNLCALASTFFLVGPVKQCKRMFAESRIVAALLFLVFLALTIVSAVVILQSSPLSPLFYSSIHGVDLVFTFIHTLCADGRTILFNVYVLTFITLLIRSSYF